MHEKVLIAMSGGVDSSVAAHLLKKQGFDCIGATMKLFNNDDIGLSREKMCCSLEDTNFARSVATKLGIPFYVFNYSSDFKKEVINRFVATYQSGATPNPCIDCNRYLKFGKLFLRAKALDINYVATGHYACVEYDKNANRYILKKAVDKAKDQSYVLYTMTQDQLQHTKFPLGELLKSEVRKIAAEQNFENAHKKESQDICFVKDNDYASFIENFTQKSCEHGKFIDIYGNILGEHRGIIRYTIGQRKGMGVAAKTPLYVHSKNIFNNTITLCKKNDLFSKSLIADSFNWIAIDEPKDEIRVKAKVRYKQKEQGATAKRLADGTVRIEFDEPQRAIAPGQAVVLYDDETVVGGGTIIEVL